MNKSSLWKIADFYNIKQVRIGSLSFSISKVWAIWIQFLSGLVDLKGVILNHDVSCLCHDECGSTWKHHTNMWTRSKTRFSSEGVFKAAARCRAGELASAKSGRKTQQIIISHGYQQMPPYLPIHRNQSVTSILVKAHIASSLHLYI